MLICSVKFKVQNIREKEIINEAFILVRSPGYVPYGFGVASGGVKFTFTDVSLVDANGAETMGTVQAVVKTQKTGQIITCSYFLDPNNQYAGQFQGIDNTVNADSAEAICDYCEQNFGGRQVPAR